ncbi:hypothetical protein Dimus_008259, partial [Dionaea muscipula]
MKHGEEIRGRARQLKRGFEPERGGVAATARATAVVAADVAAAKIDSEGFIQGERGDRVTAYRAYRVAVL